MTLLPGNILDSAAIPVHVLVVVVGTYLVHEDLPGAGRFAAEIVDFWRDPSRVFPSGQTLSSVRVLASDPDGPVEIVDGGGNALTVDRPTFEACRRALLDWSETVAASGGVGILHWVGHGRERSVGGPVVSLLCDGLDMTLQVQGGLDWSRTLAYLDTKLRGRNVFCFMDACRTHDPSQIGYEGIGPVNFALGGNAVVFHSTPRGGKAFWIDTPTDATTAAGGRDKAMGTRAFLAALESFGARFETDLPYPIVAQEIVEASSTLVGRWSVHQAVDQKGTEGPPGYRPEPILFTYGPRSIVDVRPAMASACEAEPNGTGPALPSETSAEPFQFRLNRQPHIFVWDKKKRSDLKPLFHPHVQI